MNECINIVIIIVVVVVIINVIIDDIIIIIIIIIQGNHIVWYGYWKAALLNTLYRPVSSSKTSSSNSERSCGLACERAYFTCNHSRYDFILLTLSQTSPGFYVSAVSLLKTLWEKEKLLVTSNFSFSHSVFYRF